MANFRSPSRAALNAIKAALIGALIAAPSPSPAQSAKTSSTVSVTISGPVSAIALTTGIRFSTIGLPGASPGGTPAAAPAAPAATGSLSLTESGLAAGGAACRGPHGQRRGRPGVSHLAADRVIIDLNGVCWSFATSANSAARRRAPGRRATRIAFVADVNRDQLEIFQRIAAAASETGTIFLEIPADAIASQGIAVAGDDDEPARPQIVEARRPDPFGAPDPSAKMVFVLISYN